MRISEITSSNKPYIRIVKGKKKIDVPIIPKTVVLPPNKIGFRNYAFVGCENIRVNFKGRTVRLNWTFNHNNMTLYCSSGRKAYIWSNVKVATITASNGKKEHLVVCKRAYGEETERRRYKRYPIVKKITISQGDNIFEGSTVDISYGGVGIAVKRNVRVVPSEPLVIDFGTDKPVRARLVRTIFKDDGSALLGCFIGKSYKYDMVKIVNVEADVSVTTKADEEKRKQKDTDKGWLEGEIKRWH